MRWPFVHRARLEAAKERAEWHRLNAESWRGMFENGLAELLRMKRDGFTALPPKIAPQASDPETKYAAEQEADEPDPFIAQLMSEGHSRMDALLIRQEAQEAFRNGDV